MNLDAELAASPVMVIIRNEPPERAVALCEAAWDMGVRVVEVPIQTPDAVASLAAAVAAGQPPRVRGRGRECAHPRAVARGEVGRCHVHGRGGHGARGHCARRRAGRAAHPRRRDAE